MMIETVFIDRDGVINQDSPDYIKNCDEFIFIKGSRRAIGRLTDAGKKNIIITNQSGIGRRYITLEILDAIFNKLVRGVEKKGGKIDDIFFCPHLPSNDCDCRKPLPGLIRQAIKKYPVNLKKTCMIGDSVKDMECGRAAGVGYLILVKTGNGLLAEKVLREKSIIPDYIAEDLNDASRWILGKK